MINPNQYLGEFSNAIPGQLFQEICLKVKILSPSVNAFSKMAVKWRDLTWPRKSPEFNLHQLVKISTGFKMAALTPKSGIVNIKC